MQRKLIVDLIVNHYRNDEHAFFRNALEVLKEFRDDGAKELADWLEFEMSFHYTVKPKQEKERRPFNTEIDFEDAAEHGVTFLVPQEEKENE